MDPRSERFPDLPVADLADREWAELRSLGEELQEALPAEVGVSAGFSEELRANLASRPWEFRSALRERPLLRVAAALLVISTVAAPVSALVLLFQPEPESSHELIWERQVLPAEIEDAPIRPELPAVPPAFPAGFEEAFGADWQAAIAMSNRTAVMIAQWHEAHAEESEFEPKLAPALLDWSEASLPDLQAEFERRAQLGLTSVLPASLTERVEHFIETLPEADRPAELKAWDWVLHGAGPPPVPRIFDRG